MGKTTETPESTPSSAELELLAAQEKIAQMEEELKVAQQAVLDARNEAQEKRVAETSAEERVKIRLFKDSKDYKDDLVVIVNGKAFQIQRGVEVSVPKYVAEVIERSAEQDAKTARLIESLIAEGAQAEKEMG